MGRLRERLNEKGVLLSDGAWGTMLQSQGLEPGSCPELWNVDHPERVRGVAAAYAAAGADMVLTNTFGGSAAMLRRHGLAERVAELNGAGARLSLEGAPGCIVAASIGPSGEFLKPLGDYDEEQLEGVFAEQVRAVVDAGVRVLCIETMVSVEEAACAVRAGRYVEGETGQSLEVMATMTFGPTVHGFRTVMGVDPARAVEVLTAAGADVLGANCGNGIAGMIPLIAEFRKLTDRPLLVHANAGLPEIVDGRTVYRETPEVMAARVRELVSAGASIVGGCCGTTPAHIALMRREVDAVRGLYRSEAP
ncbi:MAG: homocysteine S-methyltransferase family protein [Spirochaetales bacterium]|nr:homocysteine S-methyltransferase family protein [Spirochaetales bacterium]